MVTQAAVWVVVTIVGLLLFMAPLLQRVTARRTETFQTIVLDKRKQSLLAYVGLYIPFKTYLLIVEGGYKVEADRV